MLPRRYHIFAMPSLQNNTQRTIHILQEDFMVLSVTATSLDLAIAKAKEELKLFRAYATSNLKVQDYTFIDETVNVKKLGVQGIRYQYWSRYSKQVEEQNQINKQLSYKQLCELNYPPQLQKHTKERLSLLSINALKMVYIQAIAHSFKMIRQLGLLLAADKDGQPIDMCYYASLLIDIGDTFHNPSLLLADEQRETIISALVLYDQWVHVLQNFSDELAILIHYDIEHILQEFAGVKQLN